MDINVIRWKLNELMARKRIRNKDLAEALGITENSVYRLRKIDEMPRLAPERLNGICAVLKCQPGELLEWVPDDDGIGKTAQLELQLSGKEEKLIAKKQAKHHEPNQSFLTVVSDVLESA